jgi:hypothetical protein
MKRLIFYTMLHLKTDNAALTLSENDEAKLEDYIRCCTILNNSLSKYGQELIVLSNRPEIISNYNDGLKINKTNFYLSVPSDVKFYSAHYKIDVFYYLSSIAKGYSILLDNDKSLIMQEKSNGTWIGGELLGGDATFWGELYSLCMTYWKNYTIQLKYNPNLPLSGKLEF